MSDPNDPTDEPAPFPSAPSVSPFPPLETDPPSDWNAGADAHDLAVAHTPSREHPIAALTRFAFPPAPPLDDEAAAARDRGWVTRSILLITALMLIFNAASLQNWARQQPPGWITSTVQQLSDVWAAQLSQLGADRPREMVRDAYRAAENARFPGQPPAPPAG